MILKIAYLESLWNRLGGSRGRFLASWSTASVFLKIFCVTVAYEPQIFSERTRAICGHWPGFRIFGFDIIMKFWLTVWCFRSMVWAPSPKLNLLKIIGP